MRTCKSCDHYVVCCCVLDEAICDHYAEKWHDIRKNPNDLPEIDKRIIFIIKYPENESNYMTGNLYAAYDGSMWFASDDHEGYITPGAYKTEEVIAWKYIDKFKGVAK